MLPNYQARSPFVLKHTTSYLLASKRSERDTIRGNSIEISLYLFIYLSVYGVRETSVFARAFNYVS